jgi:O-antigen/teichoic acid export membrane protein
LIPVVPRLFAAGRRFVRGLSSDSRAGLLGLGWSYSTHALQLVLRLGSSLILTRLLDREDYGIFGPALGALFFLELLSDIGLMQAIIRFEHGEEPRFLGTAWSLIMIRGLMLAVVVCALAWILPPLYEMSAIHGVLLVLALHPILVSLQNPTLFVLYRRLNYRTPFLLDTIQTMTAIPVTIILAWQLHSVWGLVLGFLAGDVIRLALSHYLCPKAPRPAWDRPAVRELSHFGTPIFFNTLAFGAWNYFDRLVGPTLLSKKDIGLYVLAWSLAEAMEVLVTRGCDVFFSMLCRVEIGPPRSEFFWRTSRRVAIYLFPGIAIAALCAPWGFQLLYPANWYGAGVLFGLLTGRLILRATSQLQVMYLIMRGEVFLATRAYLISLAIVASTFVVWIQTLGLGVLGMAISSLVGVATFAIVLALQMIRRREASPWPTLVGLGWTAVAVAGVLAIYRI